MTRRTGRDETGRTRPADGDGGGGGGGGGRRGTSTLPTSSSRSVSVSPRMHIARVRGRLSQFCRFTANRSLPPRPPSLDESLRGRRREEPSRENSSENIERERNEGRRENRMDFLKSRLSARTRSFCSYIGRFAKRTPAPSMREGANAFLQIDRVARVLAPRIRQGWRPRSARGSLLNDASESRIQSPSGRDTISINCNILSLANLHNVFSFPRNLPFLLAYIICMYNIYIYVNYRIYYFIFSLPINYNK